MARRGGGGDEGGNPRRRLLNINDQIDSIQDASFRNYTRNIETRFQRLAEQQARMISETYDHLSQEERARARTSIREQQEQMKRSLENWRRYNSRMSDDLSVTEKFATKLFYWNRRRDLRNLEREARYRFQDIADDAEDLEESLTDSFGRVAESLRDWGTALNVNSLVNGMEDATQSTREIRTQLEKNINLTKEEWADLKQTARDFSKETGYAISNIEYLSDVSDIIIKLGIDDTDLAKDMAKLTTKFTDMTEVSMDDQAKMLEVSMLDGMGGIDYQRLVSSQMMAIQAADQLCTSGEDLMNVYNNNIDMFRDLSNGNRDLLNQYTNSSMALTAAGNAGMIDGLDEQLYDIMNMSLSDLADKMEGGQFYLKDVHDLMQSGSFDQAAKAYIEGFNEMRNQMIASAGIDGWKEMSKEMDLGDLKEAQLIEASNVRDFFEAYDNAMNVINEQTDAQIKYIDSYTPYVTRGEKIANWWKSSWLGDKLDSLLGDLDISLAEVFLGISAITDIAKLFKGNGLLSGVRGLFGGGGGAGLLSNIGNFFRAGFGGAGANTTAGAAGMNILGFGAPGGMATLGSGGAMSAGLLATGGMALGGGLWMAKDAMAGADKADEWLGRSDTSAKVMSGVGGALGGTGPGWADEGSFGDKAKNTLAGAGKGALIGGAIGSIVPGLGTAIGAAVGGAVGAIGSAIGGEKIAKAIDWMGDKLGDVWDKTKEVAGKAWEGIKGFASNAWGNIKTTASNVWSGAKKLGIDAFNTAVGVGDIAMENLFNAMGLDWGDFKTKVSEGWNNIKEWGTETWTNISSWAGEKWDWISEKAGGIWDGISTKATEIWTGITDWAGEKWDWVSEKAGDIWEGITDFASDSWDSIKTTAGDVWDGISKKASDVWDGVKKGATKAFDAVKDKAGDIWGGIKDFFSGAKSRGESITGIDGSHKTGLDSVPKDGYIAELHKDEAVLTAEQARQWRAEQNASRSTGFFHNVWKNAKLDKEALMQSYKNAMSAAAAGSSTSGSGDYSNIQVDGTGKDSVWKILRSMGYSKAATAGIMGNMQQESGVNPSAIQGNGRGPAAGIVQWENYNTKSARWAAMAQYANSKGKEWTDLQSQLEYLDKEMRGADSTTLSLLKKKVGGYDQFKALTDIDKATLVFEESFERAGTPMMSNRYSAARQFYDQFNSYDTGTPWVPNDQIALIHKGEMIVPASANPVNNSSNSGSEDSTIDDLIQVVKWGVSRIEKAITNSNQPSGYNLANMTRTRKDTASDEVFSFAST